MAIESRVCFAVLPRRSRSGRPRPTSLLGILAFLSCWGCLRPCFSQLCDGGAGAGGGGGGGAGSGDGGDAGAQHVPPTKATNNQAGAKQIHSSDNKNDDIQQLKHGMTEIWGSLASIEKHLDTIVNHIPSAAPMVSNITEIIRGSLVSMEKNLETIVNHISSDAPMVTGITEIRGSLASMEKLLETILNHIRSAAPLVTGMTEIRGSLASMEKLLETILNHIHSAAPLVTHTPENKDVVKMKGLLGFLWFIADKLPVFCGSVLLLLITSSHSRTMNSCAPNSPTPNSPAPKVDESWLQCIILGSFTLFLVSFYLGSLASKFKERESIDGGQFQMTIWLLLVVVLTLWTELCMILHFVTRISKFVMCTFGIIFCILSVVCWYFEFYNPRKQLEESKKNHVLENDILPENPEAEAALV